MQDITTTSKTFACRNCLYPVRVRFLLDKDTGKWHAGYFYDPSNSSAGELSRCPSCGQPLPNVHDHK